MSGRQVINPQAHEGRGEGVVTREVKNVHKAVKWHRVWYGVPGVEVPEIETRPNVISWFHIEDPDGNEMQ